MLFTFASVHGCLALVGNVAFVDARVSFIAFSIFYVVPIALASWYGDRTAGLILAVSAGLGGLAADVSSLGAHHPVFAFANLGCRLLLFVLIATLVVAAQGHEGPRAASGRARA